MFCDDDMIAKEWIAVSKQNYSKVNRGFCAQFKVELHQLGKAEISDSGDILNQKETTI